MKATLNGKQYEMADKDDVRRFASWWPSGSYDDAPGAVRIFVVEAARHLLATVKP